MWEPQILSEEQRKRCFNTVSSNAFYMLVGDALVSGRSLSVVRMADGEKVLMGGGDFDEAWKKRMGVDGIDAEELRERMLRAIHNCTYFASSISGVVMPHYNMDNYRAQYRYVDNFFPNAWSEAMIVNLYKAAGHVLMIHGNPNTARALTRRAELIGVRVTWIQLTNWRESESVIEQAAGCDAPLVIFSAGPASKYIGPEIAAQFGGRVTLDIGQAMDRFTLLLTEKQNINNLVA